MADLATLQQAIHQCIIEWNEIPHPFRWTTGSFHTILVKIEAGLASELATLDGAA